MQVVRKCAACHVEKRLTEDNFERRWKNKSGFRGVCLECEPPELEPEPKTWHPLKLKYMCTSKKAHKTEEGARNVAIKHALKHRGQRVRIYECPACGRWHLAVSGKVGLPAHSAFRRESSSSSVVRR